MGPVDDSGPPVIAVTPPDPTETEGQTVETLESIALEDTRRWLTRAVIGLNLCPFAKGVAAKGQIRFVVCASPEPEVLLTSLRDELLFLAEADPSEVETTLLIAPHALPDFLEFNDFLGACDAVLEALDLVGVLQIADFHPEYQFGGTQPGDSENHTNTAPYPTLHLLREASIERAIESDPEAATIYERNIARLNALGAAGWAALDVGPRLPRPVG